MKTKTPAGNRLVTENDWRGPHAERTAERNNNALGVMVDNRASAPVLGRLQNMADISPRTMQLRRQGELIFASAGSNSRQHFQRMLARAATDQSAQVQLQRQTMVTAFGIPGPQSPVVQRKVNTQGGTFDTSMYQPHFMEKVGRLEQTEVGADIKLKFTPADFYLASARHIGLTQTVKAIKSTREGEQVAFTPPDSPLKANFKLSGEEGDLGRGIDAKDQYDDAGDSQTSTNPMYGVFNKNGKVSAELHDTLPDAGFGPRNLLTRVAELYDKPRAALDFAAQAMSMQFEATAIVLEGDLRGAYLGSIAWGWEKAHGETQQPVLKPATIEKASDGIPTPNFLKAAEKWNEWNGGKRPGQHGGTDLNVVKLPVPALNRNLMAQAPSVSKLALLIVGLDLLEAQSESESNKANTANVDIAVRWLAEHLKANTQAALLIQQIDDLEERFDDIKPRLMYQLGLPLRMTSSTKVAEENHDEEWSSPNEGVVDIDSL